MICCNQPRYWVIRTAGEPLRERNTAAGGHPDGAESGYLFRKQAHASRTRTINMYFPCALFYKTVH
jgi:hypothetical protein